MYSLPQTKELGLGGFQGFGLRLGWLPKIVQEVARNHDALSGKEAVMNLGVGSNMVTSMKHWGLATATIARRGAGVSLTRFGDSLLGVDGFDPYLEDETTLWLIHWKMASNYADSIIPVWFFNDFNKSTFVVADVKKAFAEKHAGKNFSRDSLERDVNVLLKMYTASNQTAGDENLYSPFFALELLSYNEDIREYSNRFEYREGLSPLVLGFALAEIFNQREAVDFSLSSDNGISLKSIFRIAEDALLSKIDAIESLFPNSPFRLQEVSGTWRVLKTGDSCDPFDFLREYYQSNGVSNHALI